MTARKTPQDHLAKLNEMPESITLKTSKGDLTLPHFRLVPFGALRKARKSQDELDQISTLIELVCGEDSDELALLDSLPSPEVLIMFSEWTQGASLGESSGSEN